MEKGSGVSSAARPPEKTPDPFSRRPSRGVGRSPEASRRARRAREGAARGGRPRLLRRALPRSSGSWGWGPTSTEGSAPQATEPGCGAEPHLSLTPEATPSQINGGSEDPMAWKDALAGSVSAELAAEIDIFETQMELKKQGKIDEKRLRRDAAAPRRLRPALRQRPAPRRRRRADARLSRRAS